MFIIILITLLIPVGFLSFYFLCTLSQLQHHNKIHGPPSYPILGCLLSFYNNRHRLLDWYTHLLSLSPTQTIIIQRLGARRTVVTANPANVEHILKSNFLNFPKGKPFTEILGDLLGRGIFNVDGDLWCVQRKLASHEFSAKSLREFVVKTLQEEVENRLLPLLEEAAESGRVLDFQDLLRRFAFDAVCKVSLGHDPFCLDLSRAIPPLVEAFDAAAMICAMRGAAPVSAVWKLKKVFNLGAEKKLNEAIKLVHYSVMEIVQNKKNVLQTNQESSSDLLSRLLSAGHSDELVRDMVVSFIMAGRDTTSAAMTWLFWLLSNHRAAETMILSELDSLLVRTGEVKKLDYEMLKEMNFLKACLCESMRLYPPVAWDSKHAANDDVLPDGTFVGKGDRVTYFPYGMGRMEKLWGKDRFEFRPERWFGDEANEVGSPTVVNPYKFPVFQAGPRVCLGKEMAFLQMKYVMGSVLKQFEVSPVREEKPVFIPLLTAHMSGGLKVVVKRR